MVVVLALRGGKFRLVLSCNIKKDKQSVRRNSHWRGISSLDQKDSSTAACFIYKGGVSRGHFFPRPYHSPMVQFSQSIKEVTCISLFSKVLLRPLFLLFSLVFNFMQVKIPPPPFFFFLRSIFTKQKGELNLTDLKNVPDTYLQSQHLFCVQIVLHLCPNHLTNDTWF